MAKSKSPKTPHPIKLLRLASGKQVSEIAIKIGVSEAAFYHYEIGRREPKRIVLVKISEEFNCLIDDICKPGESELIKDLQAKYLSGKLKTKKKAG